MLVDFVRHEYKFKNIGFRFWKSSSTTIISIIILLLYSVFNTHTTIDKVYSVISTFTTFNPLWCLSQYSELFTVVPSKLFLYSFYLIRLHSIFHHSSVAVSTLKLKIIAVVVAIPMLSNALYVYIYIYPTHVQTTAALSFDNK